MNITAILNLLNLVLLLTFSHASSVDVSLNQGISSIAGSNAIDLTAKGLIDWALWTNNGASATTPSETMAGGSGFTSMSLLAGTSTTSNRFSGPENSYSWTNGSPTTTGASLVRPTSRVVPNNNGQGVRLIIDVTTAGSYQLIIYTTTASGTNLSATATLSNAAISHSVSGVSNNSLQKYVFTTIFETNGADTLTLDIAKIGGSNILAIEAFTLRDSPSAPDLSIEPNLEFSNNGEPELFTIPFINSGLATLDISSVVVDGVDANHFTIQSFDPSTGAGGIGNITLNFDPSDGFRDYNAKLDIISNDPETTVTTVNITVSSSAVNLGRIIFIGDSITEASSTHPPSQDDGTWLWRYQFWKNTVDYNVALEFVGTRTSNRSGPSAYPLYQGKAFDNRHEAIWGTTAQLRNNTANTYLSTVATVAPPDIAVIFVGGNDFGRTNSAATVNGRIQAIIDKLQGDVGTNGNPNIRIMVISILPRFSGEPLTTPGANNAKYEELNALLKTLVTTETTSTSEVFRLDLVDEFSNPPGLLYDGVHPNLAGEIVIGNAAYAALVPDSDNDNLIDAWELNHFTDLNSETGDGDADGDGISNLDEYVLGSNPQIKNLEPQITFSDLSLSYNLPATTGAGFEGLERYFSLESSTNLIGWDTVEQQGIADGSTQQFDIAESQSSKFFRLRVEVK